jgi:hypothetical protein
MEDYKLILTILSERSRINCLIYTCALAGSALIGVIFYGYFALNRGIDFVQFSVGLSLVSPLIIFVILLLVLRCMVCFESSVLRPLAEIEAGVSRVGTGNPLNTV